MSKNIINEAKKYILNQEYRLRVNSKLGFYNNLDDNNEIVDEAIEKLNCEFVSHLGNIFTIYRESKNNKKINL